jgi:Flp pilus assembly protein TadD
MTCQKALAQARGAFKAAIATGYVLLLMLAFAGCAAHSRGSASQGGTHSYRSQQAPEAAARCFARNAEEHSSALAAEVTRRDGAADVVVREKTASRMRRRIFVRRAAAPWVRSRSWS